MLHGRECQPDNNTVELRQYGHQWANKIGCINRLAILMRVFFNKKMYGSFCQAAKKSGHNNKVTLLPRWP